MIAIGGIIGAGLFVGSSVAIAAAGPAAVLSYLIAGTLILLVARMLSEMASTLPPVGSFTEFSRAGLGPWAGFVVGWLYWYFWIVVIPIEAIAGAIILQAWLPLPAWQLGLGLMVCMTSVNLLSVRSYGELEFWFSSIKVGAIVAFILMALAYAAGITAPDGPTFGNLVRHGGFAPGGALVVLATVTTVFFSLVGAEITLVAAAESRDPATEAARMGSRVALRILLFYVASILAIVCVVPWSKVRPGESPFSLALQEMGIGWAGTAMSFIILTAVLSCLNSAFYVSSRVLFVLAGQGDAPASLVAVNSRRVPSRAVAIGAIAGFLGVVADELAPEGLFAFLVNSSGAVILFVYIATAVAHIRLRRARERAGKPIVAGMWLFPWASYAAIAAMCGVLLAMSFSPAFAAQLLASAAALLVAFAAYFIRHFIEARG